MSENDTFRSLLKPAEGIYKEKGSKFIAYAAAIANEEDAKNQLAQIKTLHPSARHFCFAWKLGNDDHYYRVNDDGEPSGSAGLPILGQLRSFEITNVQLVVVRYFGGTKLGVSGLKNAYKAAAADALTQAKIGKRIRSRQFIIRFPYEATSAVMQQLKGLNAEIKEQQFESECMLIYRIRERDAVKLQQQLNAIEGVSFQSK
jgi:uncharacterized YigZ family protein